MHCVSLEASIGMYLSTQCGDYVATYVIIDSFELLTPPPEALFPLAMRYSNQEVFLGIGQYTFERKKKAMDF